MYQDIATKFFEHFLSIAEAMNNVGRAKGDGNGIGLWDDDDEFYYDVLNLPDGRMFPLKLHSLVGLVPLFAVETLEPQMLAQVPEFRGRLRWYLKYRKDLADLISRWTIPGVGERRLLSLLRGHRMTMLLKRMLDETKFLSPYGIRSLSQKHREEPYVFHCDSHPLTVRYEAGESESGTFGGNSNWRGPVWFPVNYLIIESLQKFHHYYGDDFKVECPTGSGNFITILEVANELTRRLTRLFLRDEHGRRPVAGPLRKDANRPALPRLPVVPRVFPRRQRPRSGGIASDGLDGPGGQTAQAAAGRVRPCARPAASWRSIERRGFFHSNECPAATEARAYATTRRSAEPQGQRRAAGRAVRRIKPRLHAALESSAQPSPARVIAGDR